MSISKNRRRKKQRAIYHTIMNALSSNVEPEKNAAALCKLKELFFGQVDSDLENMDLQSERAFLRRTLREIEGNGWVRIRRPGAAEIHLRSSLSEYIDKRRHGSGDAATNAHVVEHLRERAVQRMHPKRP